MTASPSSTTPALPARPPRIAGRRIPTLRHPHHRRRLVLRRRRQHPHGLTGRQPRIERIMDLGAILWRVRRQMQPTDPVELHMGRQLTNRPHRRRNVMASHRVDHGELRVGQGLPVLVQHLPSVGGRP